MEIDTFNHSLERAQSIGPADIASSRQELR
jgi:hypothetical protein